MKLNLLPQTVSKGRALKTAWALGTLIMLGSAGAAVLMSLSAQAKLASASDAVTQHAQPAADAVATGAAADGIIASAADVMRDTALAKAMIDHNDVYPKLYRDLNPYIPSFFRINSESAQPVDALTSKVTLIGTLGSYQQYSDLILSLMRFPDATLISRSGYVYDPTIVPNLSEDDAVGTPRKQDAAPIPTDQLQRLAYYQNLAHAQGYQGAGNFGSADATTRGAMPGESLVTIVLTVSRNLQTPDPEQTLTSAGSASAAVSTTPSFGGPGGAGPGNPFSGAGPGGPPPPGPGGPATGGGRPSSAESKAMKAAGDGD